MKPKAWILPLFLGVTLSSIYFLPKVGAVAGSAVNMQLPEESANWIFHGLAPTVDELKTLSADTEFSKALCFAPRPGEFVGFGRRVYDRVDLSIVLSGSDINNSIHRPERCMPAQGHNIISSETRTLALPDGREFDCKRLVSVQSKNNAAPGEKEKYVKYDCVTYYFFVGHDALTNDHLARTFIDMKDRLVRGMDQRWAYISVSMWYGQLEGIEKVISQDEADTKLQKFLVNFAEEQIDWSQISG